jgi:TetR/AcrR family transcriptional regulator, mexJK operon transcriptional repressor
MGGQPGIQPRKRGRPTAEERRAREAEILADVLCVFLHCGYGASTVDELAAAAQVTKRTLYAYYGDKAGLFAAMVKQLAATVSLDATSDDDTLEVLAARIVSRVHSDELVDLHRLVIAESARFPELALILHSSGDARHIARLAEHIRAERGPASEPLAEPLFSLLLGEKHRRRLLGIDPAPSPAEATRHARAALAQLGLRLTSRLCLSEVACEGDLEFRECRRIVLQVPVLMIDTVMLRHIEPDKTQHVICLHPGKQALDLSFAQ